MQSLLSYIKQKQAENASPFLMKSPSKQMSDQKAFETFKEILKNINN